MGALTEKKQAWTALPFKWFSPSRFKVPPRVRLFIVSVCSVTTRIVAIYDEWVILPNSLLYKTNPFSVNYFALGD